MSKLLVAIVHHGDADAAVEGLRDDGFRVTRLASVGGFLGVESATLLVAVEDEELERALAVFERVSRPHEVEVPLVLLGRLKDHLPRFVPHAAANIFVLDVVRHVKT